MRYGRWTLKEDSHGVYAYAELGQKKLNSATQLAKEGYISEYTTDYVDGTIGLVHIIRVQSYDVAELEMPIRVIENAIRKAEEARLMEITE